MTDHLSITTPIQGTTSHMSWGSAFAGAVIATGMMFFLGELCLAIGLGFLKPQDPGQNPSGSTIAVSGGIAWVISAIIATFIGGWASGHLARQRSDADSVLHGLLVWGIGIVLMAVLGATAVGGVVGGAFSVMGSGLHALGSATGGIVRGAGNAAGGMAQGAGSGLSSMMASTSAPTFNWDAIKHKAERLLRANPATGTQDAGAPGRPGQAGQEVGAKAPANQPAHGPAAATATVADPDDTMDLITRIFSSPTGSMSEADRATLIAQLGADTGMSQADADQLVKHWEQISKRAKERFAAMKADAEHAVRDAAASAARTLEAAAWLAFVATAFAAAAAMVGAHVGGMGALSGPRAPVIPPHGVPVAKF